MLKRNFRSDLIGKSVEMTGANLALALLCGSISAKFRWRCSVGGNVGDKTWEHWWKRILFVLLRRQTVDSVGNFVGTFVSRAVHVST